MKQIVKMIIMFSVFAINAQAQIAGKMMTEWERSERKNAIKINLLSPFYSTLCVSYQHVLSNTGSINITASYMNFDAYGSQESNITNSNRSYRGTIAYFAQKTQGFVVTPEYRYVLNGKGLSGFYLGPFMRYMYYEYSEEWERYYNYFNPQGNLVQTTQKRYDLFTYQTVGLGVVIGKQFIFKNKVTIDFFGGPVYSILTASNKSLNNEIVIGTGIPKVYIQGYGIRAGITVGLAY